MEGGDDVDGGLFIILFYCYQGALRRDERECVWKSGVFIRRSLLCVYF